MVPLFRCVWFFVSRLSVALDRVGVLQGSSLGISNYHTFG
jgi:hypothetical protein